MKHKVESQQVESQQVDEQQVDEVKKIKKFKSIRTNTSLTVVF